MKLYLQMQNALENVAKGVVEEINNMMKEFTA